MPDPLKKTRRSIESRPPEAAINSRQGGGQFAQDADASSEIKVPARTSAIQRTACHTSKQANFLPKVVIAALSALSFAQTLPCNALETWEKLDKRIKPQVFEVNTGVKFRLSDGLYAQLLDASPRNHYPVFGTTRDDKGFRVVNVGTAFPIRTNKHDRTYFLTGGHVVDSSKIKELAAECERFFAGMKLYAEQNGNGNPDAKYKELLQIVNLATKNPLVGAERKLYETTVDGIWDAYDNNLSIRVDPMRANFNKYAKMNSVDAKIGVFLHAPGPVSQKSVEPQLYKICKSDADPDLAILSVPAMTMPPLDFDVIAPNEGQEIQVIGYPTASDIIDRDSSDYYAPTFSSGRISRVTPRTLQVDAPITNGNSGSPVISLRGKVLGMVAVRAIVNKTELPNFGGAITIQSMQQFAPELFGKVAGAP